MPRAVDDTSPKGLPYGAEKQLGEFEAATAQPELEGTPGVPGTPTEEPAGFSPPGKPSGEDFDYLEALTQPTHRPDESATSGLEDFDDEEMIALSEWIPVIREMALQPNAHPYIRELAARAWALSQEA